jgi:hypothetical protein
MRGRFSHHALTKLSSNMTTNWVLASHHLRGGISMSAQTRDPAIKAAQLEAKSAI